MLSRLCNFLFILYIFFFFFNDTATTEIYTLSLHDALPIFLKAGQRLGVARAFGRQVVRDEVLRLAVAIADAEERLAVLAPRSEEHTSELQSLAYLVCRLLLEKKKKKHNQLKKNISNPNHTI